MFSFVNFCLGFSYFPLHVYFGLIFCKLFWLIIFLSSFSQNENCKSMWYTTAENCKSMLHKNAIHYPCNICVSFSCNKFFVFAFLFFSLCRFLFNSFACEFDWLFFCTASLKIRISTQCHTRMQKNCKSMLHTNSVRYPYYMFLVFLFKKFVFALLFFS